MSGNPNSATGMEGGGARAKAVSQPGMKQCFDGICREMVQKSLRYCNDLGERPSVSAVSEYLEDVQGKLWHKKGEPLYFVIIVQVSRIVRLLNAVSTT